MASSTFDRASAFGFLVRRLSEQVVVTLVLSALVVAVAVSGAGIYSLVVAKPDADGGPPRPVHNELPTHPDVLAPTEELIPATGFLVSKLKGSPVYSVEERTLVGHVHEVAEYKDLKDQYIILKPIQSTEYKILFMEEIRVMPASLKRKAGSSKKMEIFVSAVDWQNAPPIETALGAGQPEPAGGQAVHRGRLRPPPPPPYNFGPR